MVYKSNRRTHLRINPDQYETQMVVDHPVIQQKCWNQKTVCVDAAQFFDNLPHVRSKCMVYKSSRRTHLRINPDQYETQMVVDHPVIQQKFWNQKTESV